VCGRFGLGLYLERFLNEQRGDSRTLTLIFAGRGGDELLDYVYERLGARSTWR